MDTEIQGGKIFCTGKRQMDRYKTENCTKAKQRRSIRKFRFSVTGRRGFTDENVQGGASVIHPL